MVIGKRNDIGCIDVGEIIFVLRPCVIFADKSESVRLLVRPFSFD